MHADARTHSITLSDAQWKEVLHDTEAEAEDEMANEPGNIPKQTQADDTGMTEFDAEGDGKTDLPGPQVPTSVEDGDVYAYAEEADTVTNMRKGDWVSLERDRRSAFMIIMGLRSEGIV